MNQISPLERIARSFGELSVFPSNLSASRVIFPAAAVALMSAIGWRSTWLAISVFLVLIVGPLLLATVGGRPSKDEGDQEVSASDNHVPSKTRQEVLADPHFYLLVPAIVAMPFLITGIFFHQVHIAQTQQLATSAFASSFVTYAISTVSASTISGFLIDRLSARRLLPFFLWPLVIGMLVLSYAATTPMVHVFMIFAGFSTGLYATLAGAIWAELYGTKHLGAIRSMVMALMVFSTSASPFLFGILFDDGVSLVTILVMACIYVGIASLATIGIARQPLTKGIS